MVVALPLDFVSNGMINKDIMANEPRLTRGYTDGREFGQSC